MVNLTACRYFLEVVRLGSIRLAADRLHVSPSAISRQLAKLEREFDGQLVERRANGVELTEAGKVAAEHFAAIFDQVDLVKGEISDLLKLKAGSVSIATVEGISDPFLSEQIQAFRQKFPAIDFRVRIRGRERVLEALEQHLCQVGFVYDHFTHPMIEIVGQWQQPLLALAPPLHPLADGRRLHLGDLVEAAANLFEYLHRLDADGAETIAVMPVPHVGLGIAINDRLSRAAAPPSHAHTAAVTSFLIRVTSAWRPR